MADLYDKHEAQEGISASKKAWDWLTKKFQREKTLEDNEFQDILLNQTQEASQLLDTKIEELDNKLNDKDFVNDFSKTSQEVQTQNAETNKENTTNILNENEVLTKEKEESITHNNTTSTQTIQNTSKGKENELEKSQESESKELENSFFGDLIDSVSVRSEYMKNYIPVESVKKESSKEIEAEPNENNLNYFGRKALELKHTKQDKDSFKNEMKNYFSKMANSDEIKVLIGTINMKSPPSKLTKEHKDFIKECLSSAQASNPAYEHMDNSYKALTRTMLGQTIGTQSIQDVISLFNNPKNELDKAIKTDSMENTIKAIKQINKHMPDKTIEKLNMLINPMAKVMQSNQYERTLSL